MKKIVYSLSLMLFFLTAGVTSAWSEEKAAS